MSLLKRRGNYKAAVGPAAKYDLIGGLQFKVLYELGLRENHHMLDIGCGSLRGGRLFITYLLPKRYVGIEPDRELVQQGLKFELGVENANRHVKEPRFYYTDAMDLKYDGGKFNFILAQSIFTHATQEQIKMWMKFAKHSLHKQGKFIATYFRGSQNSNYKSWAPIAKYTYPWLVNVAAGVGLATYILDYDHPSEQKWLSFEHK